jgi:hypothetical protein
MRPNERQFAQGRQAVQVVEGVGQLAVPLWHELEHGAPSLSACARGRPAWQDTTVARIHLAPPSRSPWQAVDPAAIR